MGAKRKEIKLSREVKARILEEVVAVIDGKLTVFERINQDDPPTATFLSAVLDIEDAMGDLARSQQRLAELEKLDFESDSREEKEFCRAIDLRNYAERKITRLRRRFRTT